MKTIKLTSKDFKNGKYVGKENFSVYEGVDCNVEIEANLGWVSFVALKVKGYIQALAGTGIEASEGIKAGEGIEAGLGIKAGWGIKAGEGIECKLALSFRYRLFAGTSVYRGTDTEEKQVECGRLEGGTVCYGDVKELGMPDEPKKRSLSGKTVKVTLDGEEYEATIK